MKRNRCSMRIGHVGIIAMIVALGAVMGCSTSSTVRQVPRNPANGPIMGPLTSATPAALPVSEEVMFSGPPWCSPRPCVGLSAWKQLVSDGRVLGGLVIAYQLVPDWRPLAQRAVQQGTRIYAQPLAPGLDGEFRPADNVIVINSSILGEASSVIGAIAAHEVYHAATIGPNGQFANAASCVSNELDAYATESHVYEVLRRGDERTALSASLDGLIQQWHARQLREKVLVDSSDVYAPECLGGKIPAD